MPYKNKNDRAAWHRRKMAPCLRCGAMLKSAENVMWCRACARYLGRFTDEMKAPRPAYWQWHIELVSYLALSGHGTTMPEWYDCTCAAKTAYYLLATSICTSASIDLLVKLAGQSLRGLPPLLR